MVWYIMIKYTWRSRVVTTRPALILRGAITTYFFGRCPCCWLWFYGQLCPDLPNPLIKESSLNHISPSRILGTFLNQGILDDLGREVCMQLRACVHIWVPETGRSSRTLRKAWPHKAHNPMPSSYFKPPLQKSKLNLHIQLPGKPRSLKQRATTPQSSR